MELVTSFFVQGTPATAGSKQPFKNRKTGKVLMVPANKRQKPWMESVKYAAMEAYHGKPVSGPILLVCLFCLRRPKCHYGSGKNSTKLKDSSPAWPIVKPDTTKLLRAVEDALKWTIWYDDSQVCLSIPVKGYISRYENKQEGVYVMGRYENKQEGVYVMVYKLDDYDVGLNIQLPSLISTIPYR